MTEYSKLERLPQFPSPPAPADLREWSVRVQGMVQTPLTLRYEEIRALPAREVITDFRCEEGWEVQGLRWTGVALAQLVGLARPLSGARYLAVGAGQFVTLLDLSVVDEAQPLLAYLLDGSPLPWEHGGPFRLVLKSGACYQSVKWVDRLELTANDRTETAREIALGRLRRRQASGGV